MCAAGALALHEGGHLLAARCMGQEIESLRIRPYGAAIRLAHPPDSPMTECMIAFAGPAASLLGAAVAVGLLRVLPGLLFLEDFAQFSLMLALGNLLPALPLDGGRMLRAALLMICSAERAGRICFVMGMLLCGALAFWGLRGLSEGVLNPTPLSLAVLLLVGAVNERRRGVYASVSASLSRSESFARSGRMRLHTVALPRECTARSALRSLRGAALIAVMDGDMRLLGTLAEGDLVRGMVRKGPEVKLGDLLSK